MGVEATDVTAVLTRLGQGDRRAADELMPMVYDELRRMAGAALNHERRNHTLQPTAVVNEAYLRLIDQSNVDWKGRTHFRAVAAEMMQRVLIDHARGRNRLKRGGGHQRVTIDDAVALSDHGAADIEDVAEALDKLATLDGQQYRIVQLRFLGGLGVDDTARWLGLSVRTVERDWNHARAWLRRELEGAHDDDA